MPTLHPPQELQGCLRQGEEVPAEHRLLAGLAARAGCREGAVQSFAQGLARLLRGGLHRPGGLFECAQGRDFAGFGFAGGTVPGDHPGCCHSGSHGALGQLEGEGEG